MKKIRVLAWLLIVAMLTVVCPAFGEEPAIDLADGAAEEELTIDSTDDGLSDDGLIDIGAEDGLDIELPEIELEEDVAAEGNTSADAAGAGFEGNGADVGPVSAQYRPQGGADNDELFAAYVDMLFGRLPQRNGYIGDTLTGVRKKLFDYLLQEIKKIAAGTRNSTMIDIPTSVIPESQWEEAFYAVEDVIDVLLADCPFHLFWYQKVYGTIYGVSYDRGLYCDFTVAEEYGKSEYETDTTKIKAAQVAVTNAKNVVKKYAGVSDYMKLRGYRDYICDATDYNDDAVNELYYDAYYYGNPWQLIWVFDNDPSTKVVCEGYAKAFQYLCDLTSFSGGIRAYTVTGVGGDSSGSGGHMWNIVRMEDGKYYHVDITFCDTGVPEDFLVGTAQAAQSGEVFCILNNAYWYQFDDVTLRSFPQKILTLSTKDYDPNNVTPLPPTPVEPTGISIAQGKSATLYVGNTLALTAVLKPSDATTDLIWKSSKTKYATVDSDGVVTPVKAGKTDITVTTSNGKSAKITVKVVDAKSVKLKKGSKSLKSGKTVNMKKGETMTLKAVVSPSQVKTKLIWKTSKKRVATVTPDEEDPATVTVKAVRKGTATITVKTGNGKTAKITVKVK